MKLKIWLLTLELALRYGRYYSVNYRKNGRGILSRKINGCFYIVMITSLEGITMYLQGQLDLFRGKETS